MVMEKINTGVKNLLHRGSLGKKEISKFQN